MNNLPKMKILMTQAEVDSVTQELFTLADEDQDGYLTLDEFSQFQRLILLSEDKCMIENKAGLCDYVKEVLLDGLKLKLKSTVFLNRIKAQMEPTFNSIQSLQIDGNIVGKVMHVQFLEFHKKDKLEKNKVQNSQSDYIEALQETVLESDVDSIFDTNNQSIFDLAYYLDCDVI